MIRRIITVALLALGIVALASTAAQAAPRHHHKVVKHHHHKVAKHHKRVVKTCPGYRHLSPRTVALPDRRARENSALYQAVDHLICSAANHAVIDIRGYYIQPNDGPVMNRINAHLALMHKYHHVTVNVLMQANGFGLWRPAKRAMPYAHFYVCNHGCQTGSPVAKSHSKWVTVSHLQYRSGTGVITLSANLSTQQFTNAEDGVLSIANHSLYAQVAARFNSDRYCSLQPNHHCLRHPGASYWHGTSQAGTKVYFAPTVTDLPAQELASVTSCRPGDTIYYATLNLPRPAIARQLLRLKALGCTLRMVVEHPATAHPGLAWRTTSEHDKLMVVDTHAKRLVLSGSECFTPNGLHESDNIMLRFTQRAVVNSYVSYARWLYGQARYVAPVPAPVAAVAAAIGNATD